MDDKKNNKSNKINALIKLAEKEATKTKKGQLKIYLGFAPGVGKTYAMLKSAHELKTQKLDVVVGLVETHQRAETEKLLSDLEVIPRLQIQYKNKMYQELNVDEIIKRQPKLVIVDELAHSNVKGARNAKRYLDIIEILDAGIDVYTALNVQHIQSVAKDIEAITEVKVHELVSDNFVELSA